jgi:diguanylate cyclase (GGDEF)-like protein
MIAKVWVAAVVSTIVLCTWMSGTLEPISRALSDLRFAAFTQSPSGKTAVVEIDTASLAEIGHWPWPRSVYAAAIDRLMDAGADGIAIDIDLSVPSTEDSDAALEAALKRADGAVILPAFRQTTKGAGHPIVLTVPLERFARHSWSGLVDVVPDGDGEIRTFQEVADIDGNTYMSMPLILAGKDARTGARFSIDFSINPQQIERISLADLVAGRIDPSRISGRKIVIGATAVELKDYFQVPGHGYIAGSVLQALAVETALLNHRLMPIPTGLTLAGFLLLAGGGVFLSLRMPMARFFSFCLILALTIEGTATLLQQRGRLIADTAPFHAEILAYAFAAMSNEIRRRRCMWLLSSHENERLRHILQSVVSDNLEGIIVADSNGQIASASRVAQVLLGSPSVQLQSGARLAGLLPPVLNAAIERSVDCYRAGTPARKEIIEATIDTCSGHRTLECVVTVTTIEDGKTQTASTDCDFVICLLFRDVTDRKSAQARVEWMAKFDAATGLPNRRLFLERLAAVISEYRQTSGTSALMYFDLNRFKSINDGFGHATGDALLRLVGERIAHHVSDADTLARIGGDEFAILHHAASFPEDVQRFAVEISEAFAEEFAPNGFVVSCGVSIGYTEISGQDTESAAMARADAALYQAKSNAGTGICLFDAALDAELKLKRELQEDLRRALENHEFFVAYQPQVDIATGTFVGAEALVRWRHPTRGVISPGVFIPIVEQAGLISAIGELVLAEACREAATWHTPLAISVNVSVAQLTRGDLAAKCRALLRTTGLSSDRLVLELTETVLIDDPELIGKTISELRKLGIKIAIDDFGTGYSSLSYLQGLTIDKLKIDQSFVRHLPTDTGSLSIVRAIIMMADALGISVIAEGIETDEQAEFIRLLGCAEGQGYLFGRAVVAEEFQAILKDRQIGDRPENGTTCVLRSIYRGR